MTTHKLVFIVLLPILIQPLWVTIWPALLSYEELRFSFIALIELTVFILVVQSPSIRKEVGLAKIRELVFAKPLWFIIFLLALSLLWSGNIWVSLRFFTYYCAHLFFFVSLVLIFSQINTNRLLSFLYLPLIAWSIVMLFFVGPEITQDKYFPWLSDLPGFRHTRAAAQYFLFLIVFNSFLLFFYFKKNILLVFLFSLVQFFLVYLLLLSGSRACIGLMALFLICSMVYCRSKGYSASNITIFFIAFMLAWIWPFESHGLGVCRLWSCGVGFEGGEVSTITITSGRTELWELAIQKINSSGIWGMGLGSTLWATPRYDYLIYHPHNFVLQYIQDLGLLFVAIFLFVNIILLRLLYLFGFRYLSSVVVFSIFGLSLFYLLALVDGVFYFPEPILMALFFGVIIVVNTKNVGSGGSAQPVVSKAISLKSFALALFIAVLLVPNALFFFWHEMYQKKYSDYQSFWWFSQKVPINLESIEPWLKLRALTTSIDDWVIELSSMQKSASDPGKFAFYQFCALSFRDPVALENWVERENWKVLSVMDWLRINSAYTQLNRFRNLVEKEENCYTSTYSSYFLWKFAS